MDLSSLISEDAIFTGLRVASKKKLLKDLSERAGELVGLKAQLIFDTLLERERLGSTGLGHGFAIPHGKVPELERVFAMVVTLDEPIDFEAVDDAPVDLFILLLAPEAAGADHLKALARISRIARTPGTLDKLRAAHSASAIYAILSDFSESDAA